MTGDDLRALLAKVKSGELPVDDAAERLRKLPYESIEDWARVDHHRELRSGVPEVVYGGPKSAAQIAELLSALQNGGRGALATRVSADKADEILRALPEASYDADGSAVVVPGEPRVRAGVIAVVSAGSSDRPAAAEAAITAEFLGHEVVRVEDVGVAGLHRLLSVVETLRRADVIIAVAGMEGALPSVAAGLVTAPIIAVPTSTGYGVGLGGFVAMLTMLASCSPGVVVTNIDNGFGAAAAASRMCGRIRGETDEP